MAWKFDTPGNLLDFQDPAAWHDSMVAEARDIVEILVASTLGLQEDERPTDEQIAAYRDQLAYADPTVTPPPADAETIAVQSWQGFPRAVEVRAPWPQHPPTPEDPDGRYRAVEHHGQEDQGGGVFLDDDGNTLQLPVRDRQDEYLEWSARRNTEGKIVKLSFVAEGYDYFAALFKKQEARVVELYREFTGVSTLKADDLRAPKGIRVRYPGRGERTLAEPGDFNPRNRYNLEPGIVHLSHSANSLGAEVNLAGVSALARSKASGELLDGKDDKQLLCCNGGGNPNRHSDPLISQEAYRQVLSGYRYTLANPVGLYIANVHYAGLFLPDKVTAVPREWWRVTRGSTDRVLRVELEVPAAEKLTISDLLIGGGLVKHAGQIAELLSVHLFVTRWRRPAPSVGPVVKCVATCCRRTGALHLVPTEDGTCRPGYELEYPGLIASAAGAVPPGLTAPKAAGDSRTGKHR